MEHPDPKCRKNQEDFLEKCSPDQREYHARFFRIGNATYRYHQLVLSDNDNIPEPYFVEWLNGLQEPIRRDMEKRGFEACKSVLSFTRYVNERRDIGMDDFLKENLSEEDYKYHRSIGNNNDI